MFIDMVVASIGIVASFLAAGFWLGAALTTVPDNIDTIFFALRTQIQRGAHAPGSAMVAAPFPTFEFIRHSLMLVLMPPRTADCQE